jgi:hypothetical protein
MDPTKDMHHVLCKCDGDPGNDYTSVRGKKRDPYTESPNSLRQIKARQVKSKLKSMLIIFFDIKGIVQKNSSWQAKQSIPHTTVMFYGDCVKMCKDFAQNFGDKIAA